MAWLGTLLLVLSCAVIGWYVYFVEYRGSGGEGRLSPASIDTAKSDPRR